MKIHGKVPTETRKTLAGEERGGGCPGNTLWGRVEEEQSPKVPDGQGAEKHLSDVREGQGKPFRKDRHRSPVG